MDPRRSVSPSRYAIQQPELMPKNRLNISAVLACSATTLGVPGGNAFGARMKHTVDNQPLLRPKKKVASKVTHLAHRVGYNCGAQEAKIKGTKMAARKTASNKCCVGDRVSAPHLNELRWTFPRKSAKLKARMMRSNHHVCKVPPSPGAIAQLRPGITGHKVSVVRKVSTTVKQLGQEWPRAKRVAANTLCSTSTGGASPPGSSLTRPC
mmetsp:Transcript_26854/g.77695  ORF Transcript_26854/g.77695 Transcript_26854/m.77695 type:complete len:209 (+) Transcript_26854:32-658(+)